MGLTECGGTWLVTCFFQGGERSLVGFKGLGPWIVGNRWLALDECLSIHGWSSSPRTNVLGHSQPVLSKLDFCGGSTHPISNNVAWKRKPSLCHPERTQISYFTALPAETYADLLKEGRMKFTEARDFDRKSGGGEGSAVRPGSAQRSPFR
jgi:hypothetical protein